MVPARSISLPTRLIHPKAQRVEEEMKKLQALESSPSDASRVLLGLARLVELYDFVNEQVILSPQSRQALNLPCHAELMQNSLDESILLLDVCDIARDLVGTFKEQVQDLQSALRRRGGDFSSIEASIRSYITFQKKHKKAASRQLSSLVRMQTRKDKRPSLVNFSEVDQHTSMVSNILKQSNASTVSVFGSLLESFLSLQAEKTEGEKGRRSLLGKLMSGLVGKEKRRERLGDEEVKRMVRRLGELNLSLVAIHEELSCLSRRLIQHRVSLLNIVST
ncbi:PREDICTED: uncharacterized protein LOC104807439 [Tarenaya hassleriana]|uniref:uncharacterized protein LOC104807439 n=1 Tax=Tarenaya hassleriana TaxID=28532 RepID=UPI00053C775E|nr:PREDICTED: uncharacterized protein LOC104807439 [Tarenaya hassleriana]XP_010531015.1 PREDICTED: uncharacterized protein LOC104807439 [Tarenaya hassleriana]XP_010531017.1 PREDICTED: uncharacterized protein LOC104807439 [Tarenaya hassleriana]